jgi:uncharacterized protein (DUF1800 family)
MNARPLLLAAFVGSAVFSPVLHAATGVSGILTLDVATNGTKRVSWPRPLLPALEVNQLSVGPTIDGLAPIPSDVVVTTPSGYSWTVVNSLDSQFYSLRLEQKTPSSLFSANVLNRVTYGSTPDELEKIITIGPEAYLDEQLAMESPAYASDPVDSYSSVITNSLPINLTNWTFVTVTGAVTTPTLYMYLTGVGTVQLDNVQLRYSYTLTAVTNNTNTGVITTNISAVYTTNLLINGDFEQALNTGWTVSPNLAGSSIDTSASASGARNLRMVSTAAGTTQGSSIWQAFPAAPATTRGTNAAQGEIYTNTVSTLRTVLSFAYRPSADADLLIIRLSGNGIIISGDEPPPPPSWVYATATGRATATPSIYLYLSGAGEVYVDDIKLVAGTAADVGPNLVLNGNFESGDIAPWQASADYVGSAISSNTAFSGNYSLKLVGTAAGTGNGDSLYQLNVPGLVNNQTYTVSYWYTPMALSGSPRSAAAVTVRLSGSLLSSTPDNAPSGIRLRLDSQNASANLADLRAWHCSRAVGAKGQLMEVLLQFFENHFVTQHSKSSDYLDQFYDGSILDRLATSMEYRENSRWRAALTNPNCTFYDLLKVSAESPAMIIYLDTVGSRGDGTRIANENYARELFELFCMGVDNGYDQNDIVAMSRAWTGWTVDIKRAEDVDNPFAPRSNQYGLYPGVGFNAVSNLIGVWTHSFDNTWHGTNRAKILSVWSPSSPPGNPVATGPKVYPARFGAPWAGQSYQLTIPVRTGNAGMQDGYDVIRHLADLAFTAEYLSVKLCRLFIHEDFRHGAYDYTDPNRTAEAELIRQCIVAWNTPASDGRKGNIRSVLRTIFASELFRSHGGSLQKVKTPLEFVASSVRALRSANTDGTVTASTDGYSFSSALSRMGAMGLFNRSDPDGYPEAGASWISAGTLAERLRYIQSFLTAATTAGRPGDAGANVSDPVVLLKKKLPQINWRNASAVADFYLSTLFPGEGTSNLDLYRRLAVNFLNTADDGVTLSSFSALADTSAAYDTRVRGMVSLLMTTQRFQEQ